MRGPLATCPRYIVSNAGMTLLQLTRLVGAAVPGFRPALGALPNWLLWLIAPLFGVKREVAMVRGGRGRTRGSGGEG